MITRKNNAFVAKIVNTRLTKVFMAIFALAERLPISATLRGCLAMQGMGFKECEDWSSLVSAAFPPPTAEASWLRYGSARKLSTFLGFEVTFVCGIKVEAVCGPRGWAHRSLIRPTRPSLISRDHHHGGA